MPLGSFIVDWDQVKGPIVKAKYPEFEFESSLSDLAMQTFMIHSAKVPPESEISFQLEGTNIASHFFQFKEKDVLHRIMLLVILNPEESSKDYFPFLKSLEREVKNDINNPYLPEILKNAYDEMITAREFVYSEEKIKEKISDKAKMLLDKGEFTQAQKLLTKANELPQRLASTLMNAEKLSKEKNHIFAAENYEKAAFMLDEIGETDLSNQFKNKATDLKKIPGFETDLRNNIDKIEKAIRKYDFKQAIEVFQKCIKIAEELMKFPTIVELYSIRKTEYTKKMKALQNFIKADEDAKKGVVDLKAKEKLTSSETQKIKEPLAAEEAAEEQEGEEQKEEELEEEAKNNKENSEDIELEVVKDDDENW